MISKNTSSWRQQFVDAFKVLDDEEDEDDDDDEDEEEDDQGADRPPPREPTSWEYLVHFLSFFWKVGTVNFMTLTRPHDFSIR